MTTIKYAAIVVIFMVMVLDAIAVIQAQIAVRDNATVAANDAKDAYVNLQSMRQATNVASSYIEAKGGTFIGAHFSQAANRESTAVTVTAERQAHTYVYHYLEHLPWGLGKRVENLLNPTASGSSN
jgi:hypothetical protein